ncbi:ATPase, dynein-related, AAA domain containing protein [Parasponia andersonii]|uniref:ATPase, dynein-related, AAA domain containing protein n=1 Tax=Parasponia andersonii TaxID=3476 RepID=A0A2P5BA69_PARAD|nr:ATPase, dynein-related, AAA domain containing protein [Parasponia andersonii]
MLCFPLLRPSPFLTTQLKNQPSPSNFLPRNTGPFSLQCPTFSPLSHYPNRNFSRYPRFFPASFCGVSSSFSSSSEDDFDVELGRLLALLPEEMRDRLSEHPELHQLIEVVMDLGRKPLARFPSGDFVLSDSPITVEDLEYATSQVGDFAIDNRAGISRTLHRISSIRNRKGAIIGLTCRVGRAISGSANLLRYLVQDGASLLLIGPPGVGKTTIIREIARMLANDYNKRVMIVDTSNEIGGDGDIPHAGIGNARRMQVPNSDLQHEVESLRFYGTINIGLFLFMGLLDNGS